MRTRFLISGRVQGVGFRYKTNRIAKQFDVVGYVKNLSSGEVELMAEGKAEVLEELLGEIQRTFDQNISEVQQAPADTTEQFRKFAVRF